MTCHNRIFGRFFMYKSILHIFLSAVLSVTGCSASENVKQVRDIAGAHAKVVWCRQIRGDASDVFGKGNELVLMGIDTAKGREFPVINKPGNYHKPLITPDGNNIVFTDWPARKVYRVGWDGKVLKELVRGAAVEVWADPVTGVTWVYALREVSDDRDTGGPLFRFNFADTSRQETVWDKTDLTVDNIQLSFDGKSACALTPWPDAALLDLNDKSLIRSGKGCWTSMSPDNSRLMWVFDGAHRNVVLHGPDGKRMFETAINGIPGGGGHEVYHPRWSNRKDLFVLTGPYKGGGGSNRIGSGGKGVEVYAAKFSDDLSKVAKFVRVTKDKCLDIYPDLWVEGADAAIASTSPISLSGSGLNAAKRPPVAIRGVLLKKTVTPELKDILPYRQVLVVFLYKTLPDNRLIGVAHWGMREGRKVPFERVIGEEYDMKIVEYSASPELEGERVVMDFEQGDWPLYYSSEDAK